MTPTPAMQMYRKTDTSLNRDNGNVPKTIIKDIQKPLSMSVKNSGAESPKVTLTKFAMSFYCYLLILIKKYGLKKN